MARPLTRVYLLSTPLENDYEHTLYFDSKEAQRNYFSSKVKHYFDDFSYQRKDHLIRVPKHYDDIQNCNYVMYENMDSSNTPNSGKWYYAFIKEMKYVNDERTDIIIETDVIQTWMFDYTLKSCFVEREHVQVDNAGQHTYPENVELGPMIINSHKEFMGYDTATELVYVLGSTYNPKTGDDVTGKLYNGVYSGVGYYRYTTSAQVNEAIKKIVEDKGSADAITGLFMLPQWVVDSSNIGLIDETKLPADKDESVTKPYLVNGYAPRNKKLLTYPYSYFVVTNGNGSSAIYRYEEFKDSNTCPFYVYGAITPGGSIRLVPVNYKGSTGSNVDEGLTAGKFPICNFAVDMYTAWITQHAVNEKIDYEDSYKIQQAMNIGGGIVDFIGSLFADNPTATVNSFNNTANNVMGAMQQKYQASLLPDQAKGNMNSGDVATSMGVNCFQVYQMSIKEEYAKQIDGFFNMYGYQVNSLKVPNKNHRSTYWYTKCADVSMVSENIPHDDAQKIKNCYLKGITFWKTAGQTPDYFKDYSALNNTVS